MLSYEGTCHFWPKNDNKQEFFQTKHLFNFHVLWPLSLCNIKKILQADLEQRGHHVIFGPKMNHCPEQ